MIPSWPLKGLAVVKNVIISPLVSPRQSTPEHTNTHTGSMGHCVDASSVLPRACKSSTDFLSFSSNTLLSALRMIRKASANGVVRKLDTMGPSEHLARTAPSLTAIRRV
jgi:hypothetical protein